MPARSSIAAALLATPILAGAAAARTDDPSFRLNNNASSAIKEVYVSAARHEEWGTERLGRKVLEAGGTHVVRLPAGQCTNDVRVVFADGAAQEKRRIDTCALTDLAFP